MGGACRSLPTNNLQLRARNISSARRGKKRPMRHTRIIVTHYGGPDELRVIEEECPEPKDGEVRVRVLAAGVSLPDLLMREGVHPETPPLPFTPGWDLIGVVDRLGDGVSGTEPGQTGECRPRLQRVLGDLRPVWQGRIPAVFCAVQPICRRYRRLICVYGG